MTDAPARRVDRGQVARHLLRAVFLMLAVELALAVSESWTVTHLPAGTAYVLLPRGMTRWKVFAQLGCLMSAMGAFLTLPAFSVRRSLGCILRALMFVVFVGVAVGMRLDHYPAVVETQQGFVFVPRMPFAPRLMPVGTRFWVRDERHEGGRSIRVDWGIQTYRCEYVDASDAATQVVANDLVRALQAAQAAGNDAPAGAGQNH